MTPAVSVILPTHNPHLGRLARTIEGLRAQTLPTSEWELVLVDNASAAAIDLPLPDKARLVREAQLGLTHARRRGFAEATAPLCVLVDDDNVLAPDYLAQVVRLFAAHPRIGALGGKSVPEFEQPPADWQREFFDLLALRDLGSTSQIATSLRPEGATRNVYPPCAPIGAGMALRRELAVEWSRRAGVSSITDRSGGALTSGGDNDIVFSVLQQGWHVGYFPELSLTHLIPAGRLDPVYLARLNRGVQKSWPQVLALHDANPWPPIPRWSVPLRQFKAWLSTQAWRSPAAYIRWQGVCGRFEGLAALPARAD